MNPNPNQHALVIDGIIIPVTPHPEHEYTLTTAEAAAGYGVDPANIRKTLERHRDELLEGKHFSSVTNSHAGNLQRVTTIWTKRGIIRLGFFIKSERAKRFRDMAEDLCLREWDSPGIHPFDAVSILDRQINAFQIRTEADVVTFESMVALRGRLRNETGKASPILPTPSLPLYRTRRLNSEAEAIVEWVRQLAELQIAAGKAERRYKITELVTQAPPLPNKCGKKGNAIGCRLSHLTGIPIILANHRQVVLTPHRTRNERYWVFTVSEARA